jgi:hypothetical protein
MRLHILQTLLAKEARRHLANRGGVALMGMLVAVGLLLAAFGRAGPATAEALAGGAHHCYLDYSDEHPWIEHLKTHVAPELWGRIYFRKLDRAPLDENGTIVYASGTAAIQVRMIDPAGPGRFKVWVWYPRSDRHATAGFEDWFWRESRSYFQSQAEAVLGADAPKAPPLSDDSWAWLESMRTLRARARAAVPELEFERSSLIGGGLDPSAVVATALVLFTLFFVCVRLLPAFTCEERERGVLLAQALSPATSAELLGAKALFYPVLGAGLSAALAGLYEPAVLLRPFFWLAMAAASLGTFSVGLMIATLARTQRGAGMAGLAYMTVVSLVLILSQRADIPIIPWLLLEYHCPRVLHAAISDQVSPGMWLNLLGAIALSTAWLGASVSLFRRRGWQ